MKSVPETYQDFYRHSLDDECSLWTGRLPDDVGITFEELWNLHPSEYHEITMLGRRIKTPRWQQAYGMDYHYTGQVNKALPLPDALAPTLAWAKKKIDARLNGTLLNWYDGRLGHYIGRHRDSIVNMVTGAPIVTISMGEVRLFRLRPPGRKGFIDFQTAEKTVFIMPFDTNLRWTHEVPASAKSVGRRISITLRAFHK